MEPVTPRRRRPADVFVSERPTQLFISAFEPPEPERKPAKFTPAFSSGLFVDRLADQRFAGPEHLPKVAAMLAILAYLALVGSLVVS